VRTRGNDADAAAGTNTVAVKSAGLKSRTRYAPLIEALNVSDRAVAASSSLPDASSDAGG
jgi:hypothetical protein